MNIREKILKYLSAYGKTHKYKIARALKTDVTEVTKTLSELKNEGVIKIESGTAILIKGKKPIKAKARKPKEVPEEEKLPEKEAEEVAEESKLEEATEEKVKEEKPEEVIEEERIEGTVKFFNPNKGFGFITGDDGKDYYVHESGLKEGVTIEADDRVSFRVVQGDKGPKAEDVEKISQRTEELERTDL